MVVLKFLALSSLVGVLFGIGWRMFDNYRENKSWNKSW
jgi:hypothetical protein